MDGDVDSYTGRDTNEILFHPLPNRDKQFITPNKIDSILLSGKTECLTNFARTIRKIAVAMCLGAKLSHLLGTGYRFDSAYQYRLGCSLFICRYVEAIVHSIRKINIRITSIGEEHFITRRFSTVGMAGLVADTISLCLDDPANKFDSVDRAMKISPQQFSRNNGA